MEKTILDKEIERMLQITKVSRITGKEEEEKTGIFNEMQEEDNYDIVYTVQADNNGYIQFIENQHTAKIEYYGPNPIDCVSIIYNRGMHKIEYYVSTPVHGQKLLASIDSQKAVIPEYKKSPEFEEIKTMEPIGEINISDDAENVLEEIEKIIIDYPWMDSCRDFIINGINQIYSLER